MIMRGFGDRLADAMAEHGPVCVGIDPHPGLLEQWGLDHSIDGLRRFSLGVVEALGGRVGAFKPQSAFFERFGSHGVGVLEEVIDACRNAGSVCIVDAKRGDIGSTMNGYADAYLADGSPLAGDAVTLSPYLGVGSLTPALEMAKETGRGVFVLALTSNPQGASVQHCVNSEGQSVAGGVVQALSDFNATFEFEHMGPAGIVVGATVGDAPHRLGISFDAFNGTILAPGVGAQGAGPKELSEVFGQAALNVLASSSRAILAKGPDARGLQQAYAQAVAELAE